MDVWLSGLDEVSVIECAFCEFECYIERNFLLLRDVIILSLVALRSAFGDAQVDENHFSFPASEFSCIFILSWASTGRALLVTLCVTRCEQQREGSRCQGGTKTKR